MNEVSDIDTKQVTEKFHLFCSVFGYRVATHYRDIGALCLDFRIYGGYVIEQILPGSTPNSFSEQRPFCEVRMKGPELMQALDYAIRAKEFVPHTSKT